MQRFQADHEPEAQRPARPGLRLLAIGAAVVAALGLALAGGVHFFAQIGTAAQITERVQSALTQMVGPSGQVGLSGVELELGLAPVLRGEHVKISHAPSGAGLEIGGVQFTLAPLSLIADTPSPRTAQFAYMRVRLPVHLPPAEPVQFAALAQAALAQGMSALFSTNQLDLAMLDTFEIARLDVEGLALPPLRLGFKREAQDRITGELGLHGGAAMARFELLSLPGARVKLVLLPVAVAQIKTLFPVLDLDFLSAKTRFNATFESGEKKRGTLLLEIAEAGVFPKSEHAALAIKRAGMMLEWSGEAAPLRISQGYIEAEGQKIALQGEITPQPAGAAFKVRTLPFALNLPDPAPDLAEDPNRSNAPSQARAIPMKLFDALFFEFSGRYSKAEESLAPSLAPSLALDTLTFGQADTALVEGTGRLEFSAVAAKTPAATDNGADTGPMGLHRLDITLRANPMPAPLALWLWPRFAAPKLRHWLVQNGVYGTLDVPEFALSLDSAGLAALGTHTPLADNALAIRFRLAQGGFATLPGLAPLRVEEAFGAVKGHRTQIDLAKTALATPKGAIEARQAQLVVAHSEERPVPLAFSIPHMRGPITGAALLPALQAFFDLPGDTTLQDGVFEGKLAFTLPIAPDKALPVRAVEANFEARQVRIARAFRDYPLQDAKLRVQIKGERTTLEGQGRLDGMPLDLTYRGEGAREGKFEAKMVLEEADFSRLAGVETKAFLSGPVGVTVNVGVAKGQAGAPDITLDLGQARVEYPLLGIAKKPGQRGTVRLGFKADAGGAKPGSAKPGFAAFTLQEVDAQIGTFAARGQIDWSGDAVQRADFSSFAIGAADSARVTLEKSRTGYKYVVRGNTLDIRPLLRPLLKGNSAEEGDLDIELNVTVLVGFNGELMTGAQTRLLRQAGKVSMLDVSGSFVGLPMRVALARTGADAGRLIDFSAGNAGALLRFLDLYNRMEGGRLSGRIMLEAGQQKGNLLLHDFALKGEPALRRVARGGDSLNPMQAGDRGIEFTKLRADFARAQGRFTLQDAVMWGAEMGGTLEGVLDYAEDRVEMKGAFVPAYALNNLFARVPIVGPILGGNRYEGLFTLPFEITGKASAPVLKVNAAGAATPGILRRIFDERKELRPEE